MIKEKRSWSKPENIPNFIGRKKVDWSLFEYGIYIPAEFLEDFKKANGGVHLDRGESHALKLIIEGNPFDANLININQQNTSIAIQVRYDNNNQLKTLLRERLKVSYNYLQEERVKHSESGEKTKIIVPDNLAEYIDFYETGTPFQYRLEIITSQPGLAMPFKQIFANEEEANWAFELMTEAAKRLGISSGNDSRLSISLPYNATALHFNFCNWLILGFRRSKSGLLEVGFPLLEERVKDKADKIVYRFAQKENEPKIFYCVFPDKTVKSFEEDLRQVFEETISQIEKRFNNYTKTPFKKSHIQQVASALFDLNEREQLLREGLNRIELEKSTLKIWWVNQGDSINNEKIEGILWAPLKASDGRSLYHWEALEEVQEGDIIVHYANGALRYVSEVISGAVDAPKTNESSDRLGRLVLVNYYDLIPEIELGKISDEILKLNLTQGPIDSTGRVKQGYLFRLNLEALQIIQNAQPETHWPDFALTNGLTHLGDSEKNSATNYWVFQGNPKSFNVIGALKDGKLKNWSISAHKNKIKKGDKVILWVAGSEAGCYALATVVSDVYYGYDDEEKVKYYVGQNQNEEHDRCKLEFDYIIYKNPILKVEIANNPILNNLKVGLQGTNFYATKEQYDEIRRLAETREKTIPNPEYSLADLSSDTGMDEQELARWIRAIHRKGQAILFGPPGTGKTYVAERMARHLIGGGFGFFDLVQFHPAYAYEDFIQGIRPVSQNGGGLEYPMVPGRFLEFCNKAKLRQGKCVLIIDEINRANLTRVFGELMYLLEYRDREIPLAGGGVFKIPSNVFIVGTMNTADRSIALVDHALRRRFAFLALYPNYEVLRKFHAQTLFPIEGLIEVLQKMNKQIAERHYEVGISFFLREGLEEQLEDIWRMEIEPYLEEYFFDQPDKVANYRWDKVREKILL